MHLFRSILNAHFLRYVTLVIVGFIFLNSIHLQYRNENNFIVFQLSIVEEANAALSNENGTITAEGNQLVDDWINDNAVAATKDVDTTLINVLNTVIALISLIYVPFSMLSSWLLSPDWTFGDFIHLRGTLHSLWIFVSNTVYVVFAAMLIVVAIANIFGQSDSYAIKKMLPRFIIGVIMVPFTWWIVSATLSVSSYMTALVLRMPADIINANQSIKTEVEVPKKCYLDFTNSDASKKIWHCDDPEKQDLAEYLLKSDGAYGIIPLYAYNIFKFNNLDAFKTILNSDDTRVAGYESMTPEDKAKFDAADKETKSAMLQAAIIATGLGKIGIQLLMSALFAIVFTIVLIALVLVLFTRVIRMWMYAIFSPLFALRYFLSDKIDKDNALSKFDFKEFIGLAMVPVVVSAALGFGFMFIMTFKSHMEQATTAKTGIESDYIKVVDNTANSGSIKFFGTTIDIKMSEDNSNGVGVDGQPVKADNLKAALFNVLSGLITPIFGVVILWMAVMAAIKTSKVAGAAVEGIEKMGGEIAGMTKKLPGMIPLGTVTRGGEKIKITGNGLGKIPDVFRGVLSEKESKQQAYMKQALGFSEGKFESVLAKANAAHASNNKEEMKKVLAQLAASGYTREDLNQPAMLDILTKYNKTVLNGSETVSAANFDQILQKIGDQLKQEGKLTSGENSTTFMQNFKKGGQALSTILNMNANITLTRGTHKLDIEDKKNIKYTLNGEEKSIEIDISDLTSKTTNDERKDYIKTQIENAFSLKSLSIDETSLKVLVKKMFDENPPPGAGGGGTP